MGKLPACWASPGAVQASGERTAVTCRRTDVGKKAQKPGFYLITALDRKRVRTGKVGIFGTTPRHMTTDRHTHSAPYKAGEPCAKEVVKVLDKAEIVDRIIFVARSQRLMAVT
jgi:hypothetical protein